ncbi:MAG: ral secretion pathway protein GspH [Moraxellaceae bacterium]|jgi:general secretion pathway protein H|nr:ral secretion pathway protein GspH [Moraxellaceae bacterium]
MAATRRPSAISPQGFTLLEVLMVVLLVGILGSVVVLSVNTGGPERHLPEESSRLAALLEQAGNEAVMQNQEYGLRVTGQGYVFLCLDEVKQRWNPCADEVFRERELPGGLELRLVKQGSIKELPSLEAEDDAAASSAARQRAEEENPQLRVTPDIFMLSSGESSGASLEIRVVESPDLRSEVSIDEIGRVRVDGEGRGTDTPAGGDDAGPA